MASIVNKAELSRFIDDIVKPLGYTRKKDNWYCRTDDCICVLALDKSPYGGQFYLEVCIWLTHLDTKVEYPTFYKCHIRNRLDEMTADRDRTQRALNLDDLDMTAEERGTIIEQTIRDVGLPTLKSLSTLDTIRDWLTHGDTRRWIVLPEVKNLFGIPTSTEDA